MSQSNYEVHLPFQQLPSSVKETWAWIWWLRYDHKVQVCQVLVESLVANRSYPCYRLLDRIVNNIPPHSKTQKDESMCVCDYPLSETHLDSTQQRIKTTCINKCRERCGKGIDNGIQKTDNLGDILYIQRYISHLSFWSHFLPLRIHTFVCIHCWLPNICTSIGMTPADMSIWPPGWFCNTQESSVNNASKNSRG